jgi:hypothetical protein
VVLFDRKILKSCAELFNAIVDGTNRLQALSAESENNVVLFDCFYNVVDRVLLERSLHCF